MSSTDELMRLAKVQAADQIEMTHRSVDANQNHLDRVIMQIAALGNAKLYDTFLANAALKHGVPSSGGPSLEESLRQMLEDAKPADTPAVPQPAPVIPQPPAPAGGGLSKWVWPLITVAAISAGAGGLGWGLSQVPARISPDEQENYRYNYLEARGLHLPPENGDEATE